ncbi:hypothetical protein DMC30DRAFT_418396 [Rhodotorula diobovata]|uniref:Uncharacterized protein n=1 Tax=Rhodotorula diobovata TaxID=5288 RepID=A0A5C5FSG8_9BASI|nr:hypothetical protein DMC30DRAFT_418396 [Rhodotorula diobovata]
MVQGFKAKPPANTHKNKSSTQKKQQPKDLKKGGESLKAAAVSHGVVHRKNTSSHATGLEKQIAAQALSHGKLTIMRKAAEEKKAKDAASADKK